MSCEERAWPNTRLGVSHCIHVFSRALVGLTGEHGCRRHARSIVASKKTIIRSNGAAKEQCFGRNGEVGV